MVTGLTTREKILEKSKPTAWLKPFATSLALYLFIEPDAFSFTLNTHLQPIGFLPGGKETRSQVWFFIKASYSCCMTESQLGSCKACLTDLGSQWASRRVGFILCKWMWDIDLVCKGWVFIESMRRSKIHRWGCRFWTNNKNRSINNKRILICRVMIRGLCWIKGRYFYVRLSWLMNRRWLYRNGRRVINIRRMMMNKSGWDIGLSRLG